ncbi:MAG: hypothetical protein RIR26_2530 [Pseudomonadota bacterium]
MRTVFQVVATMAVANAAVAYGSAAKDTANKVKSAATATATGVKEKASEVKTDVKAATVETKTTVKEAVQEATKKTEAQPSKTTPATGTISMGEAKEMAKEATEGQPKNSEELAGSRKSLIIPESAVLPESVLRFRAIYAGASSKKGYDAQGETTKNGLAVNVNRSVAVFEYGLTDRISAQLLVPYSLSGKASVDDKEMFITKVGGPGLLVDQTAGPLITGAKTLLLTKIQSPSNASEQGLAALYGKLVNGGKAPSDIPLTGTGVTIPSGADVKDFIDNQFVTKLAEVQARANYETIKKKVEDTKFQKGLGDVEIGAKYALSTVQAPWFAGVPLYTSAAAGVRLNSSNYSKAMKDGERPVGRGTTDLGIRLNADYEPLNGVQLQVENQSEFMIMKGKTYAGSKEVDYARDGVRQVGYSKLVLAPGTWISSADFLMLNARYNWDNDAATKTDGVKSTGPAVVGRTMQFGLGFDGLKLKLPVQLDYDRVMATKSRNVSTALDANVVTLKLFYKF